MREEYLEPELKIVCFTAKERLALEIGDEVSDVADTIGLVAPRVMLCAAHQAHTVLRILAGEYEV